MEKNQKSSHPKNRHFTLLVVALFVLSTVGSVMLSSSGNNNSEVKFPESNIVDRQFTYGELQAIRQSGFVAVMFSSEACTENCELIRMGLERTVQKYSPYVFMSEIYNVSAPITIIGYSSVDEFDEFNQTVIDKYICQSLYLQPAEKSKYCLPASFAQ